MTRSVLWDSSAILALLDADDADHSRAISVARNIASKRRPSFITNYVEAEVHALLVQFYLYVVSAFSGPRDVSRGIAPETPCSPCQACQPPSLYMNAGGTEVVCCPAGAAGVS